MKHQHFRKVQCELREGKENGVWEHETPQREGISFLQSSYIRQGDGGSMALDVGNLAFVLFMKVASTSITD